MDNAKAICWLELETTGSDVELDYIMEIGAVMTDFDFEELGETPYSEVIGLPNVGFERVNNNPVVKKMHTENGLLEECKKSLPFDFDDHFKNWMRSLVPQGKVILAGSGVSHFDRKFITRYMWQTDRLLTYPMLDIGVVRRYLRYIGILPENEKWWEPKSHRALDDIRQHLGEARRYKRLLVRSEAFDNEC